VAQETADNLASAAPAELEPIPITKPVFGDEERRAIAQPLETGWVVQGPHTAEFEAKFSAYTGAAHSAAASSCTTALHIAFAALGAGPGDEVIVPSFTWVATANMVELCGATPVFCDIDLATFNVDAASVEAAVTERTVGIVPVHLFGLPAPLEPILELARRRGLWVVEDAACSLGGWYRGSHTGTLGDIGCFSFHPRKSITTGEGGMVTTQDAALDRVVRSLRDHGSSQSDFDRHTTSGGFLLSAYDRLGFNYRLTDFQGALGSAQMDRLEWILEGRRRVASGYDEALADVEWLRLPVTPEGCVHGYQAYVTLFAPEEPVLANAADLHERRNRLMTRLEREGIATRQGTHSPVLTGYHAEKHGLRPEDFPNGVLADLLTVALPLYPQLTEGEQERVVSALTAA
jgi:dTDP-4-amino-4,6-dideoxygalactose transaminase